MDGRFGNAHINKTFRTPIKLFGHLLCDKEMLFKNESEFFLYLIALFILKNNGN